MLCEFLAHFAKESKIKRNTKRGRFRFSFLRAPRSTISLLIDRLDKNIDLEEFFRFLSHSRLTIVLFYPKMENGGAANSLGKASGRLTREGIKGEGGGTATFQR